MSKEGDTEPGTGLAVFKAAAELAGKDSVFTQLAEATGLTHRARVKKAESLAKLADAYNLPKNDPDVVLAMVEQVVGASPAAVERIRSRIERDQTRLEAAAEEVASQHNAEQPALALGLVAQPIFEAWCDQVMAILDESMRASWARLLRMEASTPGSFSLRGIEALRLFSKDDARVLEVIASNTFLASQAFLLAEEEGVTMHINYLDRIRARSLNILSSDVESHFNIGSTRTEGLKLCLPDRRFFVAKPLECVDLVIGINVLTPLGRELIRLPTVEPNEAAVQHLIGVLTACKWGYEISPPEA